MHVAVIGAGRIGRVHATNLSANPAVERLSIGDTDPARAAGLAGELGATALTPAEALGTRPDALVIAAASDAHESLLRAAIEAGIPAFCEKPLSPSLPAAAALARDAREAGAHIQMGFQRRFDAGFNAARTAAQDGSLGFVHTIRAGTLDPAPPPADYIPVSGGLFHDCSVHDFDMVRFVSGQEVREVFTFGGNKGGGVFAEYDDVDTGVVVMMLDDDTVAVVSCTRFNAAGYDVRLEALGAKASIVVGLTDSTPLANAEPGVAMPTGPAYQGFIDRFAPAYRAEIDSFVESVAGSVPPACTVADAVAATLIAEAATRSRREHRPVAVKDVTL